MSVDRKQWARNANGEINENKMTGVMLKGLDFIKKQPTYKF